MCRAPLRGCYASTEPATDIGPESATLNAQGTANSGPAFSSFKYGLTGSPADPLNSSGFRWPAGVSGPFSTKVTGLAAGAEYSFRVCGSDSGMPTYCAQTRTFKTPPAVEDSVVGVVLGGCCARARVDAHSSATGANPRGTVFANLNAETTFSGDVTCLAVDGRSAVIGVVGLEDPPGLPPRPATLLAYIVDGHLSGLDRYGDQETLGSTPPDCGTTNLPPQFESPLNQSTLVVNDAL